MKIWNYYLPSEKGEGWGKFIIDSTGYFSCVTDYGNYAFQWTAHGDNDFREFLCSLDGGYLMGKLGAVKSKILDSDALIERVRKTLLEKRREGCWDRDLVREWWDAIDGCTTEREFEDFFTRTAVYKNDQVFDDWWDMFDMVYPPDIQALTKRLWPRFVATLKAELAVTERVLKEKV